MTAGIKVPYHEGNLFGDPSFFREQWLYLMKTKRKDVTMQKCRDWIRRKDNRKKLLLPVLFFRLLMVSSMLCLPWLRQLMEKQEGWLILMKEHAPWTMLAIGAIDSANTLLAQQQSGFPLFTVIPMLYLFSTLLLLFTAIYGFVRHSLR